MDSKEKVLASNMKRIFILMLTVLLVSIVSSQMAYAEKHQMNVSLFSDHIKSMASQEGISFEEAAHRVKDMGYRGVDVWVTVNADELRILNDLGFEHASAITYIDYTKGAMGELEDKTLAFMEKEGFKRVLLVPGVFDNVTCDPLDSVTARIDRFSRRAAARGLEVTVEDYDDERTPCYNTEALNRLFSNAPKLRMTFDTGNFIYCGEDVMKALKHFRKHISHVHLKDRIKVHDKTMPAPGMGIVQMKQVVETLLRKGYKGWFAVEIFGNPQMQQSLKTALDTLYGN